MKIITVGKKPQPWLNTGMEAYFKRLQGRYKVEFTYLPSSKKECEGARLNESLEILSRIKQDDFVILLDETGKNISSPALSELMQANVSKNIVFVIGGAYGVSHELKKRANFIWSLSNLVFPHQIVRLILIEQIYRAQTIASNHPYHHQ